MTGHPRNLSRYDSLRTSGVVLGRMAPLVRLGLFGIGVSLFLDQARPLLSDVQLTWGERRILGIVALFSLGGFGLAGWVAARLLRASGELIDLLVDGADAAWRTADLIELQMVPTLGRIANALERSPGRPREDDGARVVAEVRKAIAGGRWIEAERLVGELARDVPGTAEAVAVVDELAEAREAVVEELRARLETARKANDPIAVIEARDALTEHLRGGPLHDLDQKVVRWLVNLIQKRVRAGTVDINVAALAARVADDFGDTVEGADLRTLLPTLRRSAGLCPRCGRPNAGTAAACPKCIATDRGAARVGTPEISS